MLVRPQLKFVFVLALALLGAALAWHYRFDDPDSAIQQVPAEPTQRANEVWADPGDIPLQSLARTNNTGQENSASAPTWEPPVADQPLPEIFAALDAEARRGNARAACRLAMELDRCHEAWPAARNMLGAMEAMAGRNVADNAAQPDRARNRATMETVFEQLETICAGSETLASTSKLRYLGIAADGGNVPSMVRYLESGRLSAGALMDDPALLTHFRAHAPSYFLAALRAGNIDLLTQWRMALLSPHDSALFRVLPNEFRNVGLLNALEAQLSSEQRTGMFLGFREPGIGEQPTAGDHARAAELYRAHFTNSSPSGSAIAALADGYEAHLRHLSALDLGDCE